MSWPSGTSLLHLLLPLLLLGCNKSNSIRSSISSNCDSTCCCCKFGLMHQNKISPKHLDSSLMGGCRNSVKAFVVYPCEEMNPLFYLQGRRTRASPKLLQSSASEPAVKDPLLYIYFFPLDPNIKCFWWYGDGIGLCYQSEFHYRDAFLVKVKGGVHFMAGQHNAAQDINAQNMINEKIDFTDQFSFFAALYSSTSPPVMHNHWLQIM